MDPDESIVTDDEAISEELPDTTDDEPATKKVDDVKNGDRRSEIAQKIKWRDKAKANETRAQTLENELADLRELVKKPSDDQEAKAQEYIRAQAREVYQELQRTQKDSKEQKTARFKSEIDDLLEENPDVSEEELLDVIEELDVEPSVALKILKRGSSSKKEKPHLPKSGRASPEAKKELPDDSKKSIFQIAQDEINRIRGN